MSPQQEDRGVEPDSEEVILTGEDAALTAAKHINDATGRPAAMEDDLAGD